MEDTESPPSARISGGIFSLRLVTVDHYMHYPVAELDPCYSDYRGSVISKVPVIRIFGTDGDGTKTCAHIHGVFPYLYIPYDGRSADEDADRFSYQLASSLDKALNISLGQSSSDTEHVFKIVHVKGIPFYGYHPKAHQFLKIYLYNPGLIRRVGGLLQNGTILGRVFQAHETHVPYVLQFMIDYNLYGMSSLHCPADHLRYRRSPNDNIPDGRHHQIHKKLERTATSKQECDIAAAYILNRLEINTNTVASSQQSHANPGIATIWKDERVRRDRMPPAAGDPPALEVPLPEQRPHAEIAESELFHLDVLRAKLEQMASAGGTDQSTLLGDATLSETGLSAILTNNKSLVDQQNRSKFNLKRLLANSVYPAECSQQSGLLDASCIVDHQSGRAGRPRRSQRHAMQESFLNDTVVDEELILSLSQAVNSGDISLNEDEFRLLDVMKLLEDDQMAAIDGDSILAPLSQTKSSQPNRSQPKKASDLNDNAPSADVDWDDSDFDPDDNLLNDFSICMPDEDSTRPDGLKTAIKFDADDQTLATMRIPQLDGVSGADTPRRTPRSKYAPLNITVHTTTTPLASVSKRRISISPGHTPKRSRLEAISQLPPIDSPSIDLTLSDDEAPPNGIDVSFVDCRLRGHSKPSNPTRTEPAARVLRTVKIPESPAKLQPSSSPSLPAPECVETEPPSSDPPPVDHVQIMQHLPFVRLLKYSDIERAFDAKTPLLATPEPAATVRRSLRSHTPKPSPAATEDVPSTDRKLRSKRATSNKSEPTLDELFARIDCEVSRRYDEGHNFFPEPGPSTVNYYENVDIPGYYGPSKATTEATPFAAPKTQIGGAKRGRKRKVPEAPPIVGNCVLVPLLRSPTFDEVLSQMPIYGIPYSSEGETIDDDKVEAFCSDVLKDGSGLNARKQAIESRRVTTPSKPVTANGGRRAAAAATTATTTAAPAPPPPKPKDGTVLMPLLRSPTYDEVLAAMPDYDIPYCVEEEPFYSNAADATARKEVGNTLLVIPTRTLDDLEQFESSVLDPDVGIAARKQQLERKLIGHENGTAKRPTSKQVRALFATDEPCVLRAVRAAPSVADAKQWVKINLRGIANGNGGGDGVDDRLDDPLFIANGGNDSLALLKDPLSLSPPAPTTLRSAKSVRQTPSGSGSLSPDIIECSPSSDIDPRLTSLRRRSRTLLEQSPATKAANGSASPEPSVKVLRSALDRIRRANAPSPSLFGSASPASASDVICLDDDDDEHVAVANGVSQLFSNVRETTVKNGHAKAGPAANLVLDGQESLVADHSFGITGATLENTFGFKMDLENLQTANAHSDFNYLTIMSLEVHVPTRGNLRPDPAHDAIVCLLYNIQNNVPDRHGQAEALGVILQTDGEPDGDQYTAGLRRLAKAAHPAHAIDVTCVHTEHDLLQHLMALVAHWDPDIFAGYEIEMASWGYVLQRAQHLGINMKMHLSRVPTSQAGATRPTDGDEEAAAQAQAGFYGSEYVEFEVRLAGRIFLDVWRLMRSEMALTSYTFENVMYHVLHRRCPHYGYRELSRLWRRPAAMKVATTNGSSDGGGANVTHRWAVLEYYVERVLGNLELLNQLDLIGRTCELAKLFGIQFFEVLSRGSQFRVESMMLRMAKPKNIIPVSPSVQQRAHMRAPEYLPLILEPLSRMYTDSLIVLDFQSLYPSVIIAYNYCFSTCLGRVEHLGQSEPFEFGASQLRVSRKLLRKLLDRDLVTVSPCGVVFVKAEVREGVLPRMLREILDTRLMVKQSMKLHRDDRLLQRVLHSRQLGLKLMANVTYGYTAANFSGRMPCVEIADSVVSKGRETLERAIKTVSSNTKRWRSRVIYGDTDSLFVLVPGRTREDAFRIGTEIVDAVTQANPHPIKLKLEKIYQPSILQTKKRYVGYMYETPDQQHPVYEAKGIETVRRDGCPAVAKMLEKTLKTLFETRDVSAVKAYVCRQFTKIMGGRANLQDFTFAKEFRGLQGYKPGACVPSLELTRRWMQLDGRAEPRRGERVPYVIVNGPPGLPLIRLVRSPLEFMSDEGMTINAVYYITKVIVPALNRCLLLIGANAFNWYADLPRPQLATVNTVRAKEMAMQMAAPPSLKMSVAAGGGGSKKSTIAQYFATTGCPTDCGAQTKDDLCAECRRRPQATAVILGAKMAAQDRRLALLQRTCASCCAGPLATGTQSMRCESLDCPVLHVLCNARREHAQVAYWRELLAKYCE